MFSEDNDCYGLKTIRNQQNYTSSNRKSLPLNEYLDKIKPDLVQLINNNKDNKIQPTMHVVFDSTRSFNDKKTLYIKIKYLTTNVDEIIEVLIEHYKDLLKKINDLILEGVESINFSFKNNETISTTYIQSPQ